MGRNSLEPESSARLFLALPLADLFARELIQIIDFLKPLIPNVKWVLPGQVHLTLHFFGETNLEKIDLIHEQVRQISRRNNPLQVGLEGIGFFPNNLRPRVIWAGLKGQVEEVKQMQSELVHALGSKGFPIEDRPFQPHATIGRIKDRGKESIQIPPGILSKTSDLKCIDKIVLFKSCLKENGPVYEVLQSYPLSKK